MTQYFYVDESGDPGLHKYKSSPYFVIAMVQTPDWKPIDELATLRKVLHLLPSFEFHYAKMSPVQRQAFYEAVLSLPFRVRAAVILKDEAPLDARRSKSHFRSRKKTARHLERQRLAIKI